MKAHQRKRSLAPLLGCLVLSVAVQAQPPEKKNQKPASKQVREWAARPPEPFESWGKCELFESGGANQVMLLAELVEKLVVVLPGGDPLWDASCRTDRSRIVFEARMETRDAIVEASIEKSDAAALSPFSEAAYLKVLTKLIAEGATEKKVLAQDAGQEAVLGQHVAQFLRLDEQAKSRSLHGYAARRLKNDVVLVLHVSETSRSLEREPSKKMLKNLLGLFGKEAELFETAD